MLQVFPHTHGSHISHTGYEDSKKWVCQKKQGEKAKEKPWDDNPPHLGNFSDRRKGSISYSKKKQTNVRKTGLLRIIPRIIAVLYAFSPLKKMLQTFSRLKISPDFEVSFWWNIRTWKVSSIFQKIIAGTNSWYWWFQMVVGSKTSGYGLTMPALKFPENDWKDKSRIIHH